MEWFCGESARKCIGMIIKLMTQDPLTQTKKNIVTATAALTHRIRLSKRFNSFNSILNSLILSRLLLI